MSYFAQIDENNNVINVIVVEKEDIESGRFGDPKFWVETDFYTARGIHYGENGAPDGGTPFRGNYASIGGKYDKVHDVFYEPQPFPSWSISGPDWCWKPPIPKPPKTETTRNVWNEETLSWDQITI